MFPLNVVVYELRASEARKLLRIYIPNHFPVSAYRTELSFFILF